MFKREFRKPIIDYGVKKDGNAWRIYNLLTYAIEQKAHPNHYIEQHKEVYKYFTNQII